MSDVSSHEVDECGVTSAATLAEYREKRDEWMTWLEHDPHHAIARQITSMMWSDAVFRLVNASRAHATEAGGGFAALNRTLGAALDRGYVA